MYTVLICDDEEPVLQSYSFIIENGAPGFRIGGLARSGFEAIGMARQSRPDVVIMDIGMPGIDGLQTIEEMRSQFPETLFLLSTAYERFDLAQRAIPLGVFRYLVKPVTKKALLDTLQEMEAHLDEKRARASFRLQEAQRAAETLELEKRSFLNLLTWKILTDEEWARYRRMFEIGSDTGRIVMIYFPDTSAEEAGKLYAETARRLSHRIASLSTGYLGKLLIFVPDPSGEEQLKALLSTILGSLAAGMRYRICFGGPRRYDELYLSCNEALEGFADLDQESREDDALPRAARELRKLLSAGASFEELYERYGAFLDLTGRTNLFPVVQAKVTALFALILDELPVHIHVDPAREIMGLTTVEQVGSWGARHLRLILERSRTDFRENRPAPLASALRMIEENFREPLTLSQLAEDCGVTPSYLCRLFSEHLSSNFVDYLNAVRIRAAEEKLREGRLSVKEIAYTVGYQDPNYFSRVFKKRKGVTPTSYSSRRDDHEST